MDRQTKKDYLITLIKQSELPTSKLNTLRMQWESIDLEKVADFLLDNGVDIVNPYSKLFESCEEGNIRCKDCKFGRPLDRTKSPEKYYKDDCIVCECEDVVGDEPMIYPPEHYCGFGRSG